MLLNVLLLIIFTAVLDANLTQPIDINEKDVKLNIEHALDVMDNSLGRAWTWTKTHRQFLKGISGGFILFYGSQFAKTLLLIKTITVTGAPAIFQSIKDLRDTYIRARKAVKENLPQIIDAKAKVEELSRKVLMLKGQMEDLQSDLTASKIGKEIFTVNYEKLQREINVSSASLKNLNALTNSINNIKHAVDPIHLQQIVSNLHVSLMSCVAAAQSQLAASVTRGLHVGKILAESIVKLVPISTNAGGKLSAHFEGVKDFMLIQDNEWIQTAINFGSRAVGVIVAVAFKRAIVTVSICMMGAQLLTNAVVELLDPILSSQKLPTLEERPGHITAIQTGFLVTGLLNQFKLGDTRLPIGIRLVLSPVLLLETFVTKNLMKL